MLTLLNAIGASEIRNLFQNSFLNIFENRKKSNLTGEVLVENDETLITGTNFSDDFAEMYEHEVKFSNQRQEKLPFILYAGDDNVPVNSSYYNCLTPYINLYSFKNCKNLQFMHSVNYTSVN